MDAVTEIYDSMFGYHRSLSVALGYRDMMTLVHSERVCDLALMIAEDSGISDLDQAVLKVASTLHDVGKIGIPDHILMKPGKLDATEWQMIRMHSEIGEQIVLSAGVDDQPAIDVARIIRHHHEYFGGGGYPDGLKGEDIPLSSRIIAIADSYDAMAATRAYHAARSHDEIMDIMEEETGSKFDPALMQIFCERIALSPMRVD
jgi:HD-GYP domain-containing protein (c-di-GMP phosphodiesterase class II)